MTLGAGLLVLADPPKGGEHGFSGLAPLADLGSTGSLESVLWTEHGIDHSRWQAIVIHHSASPYETLETLDRKHRQMGLRGLGHHFVIGRGDGLGDGQVASGFRWIKQLPGAHALGPQSDWYNQHAISICLVGDGDRHAFTSAQLARLRQLVSALEEELGLDASRVVLHSAIAPTTDPGWRFPEAWFYEQITPGG